MKNLIPKRVMEYIIITFAVVLMDVGIYVFKFPNNFSFGGVSGMAVVFSHFIPMTSAQINLVINLILLVIGFIVLGRDFGVKTAYVTVVSSLLLNVFEKVFPMDRALTGNIMLELCFAIILPALAAALLFFSPSVPALQRAFPDPAAPPPVYRRRLLDWRPSVQAQPWAQAQPLSCFPALPGAALPRTKYRQYYSLLP